MKPLLPALALLLPLAAQPNWTEHKDPKGFTVRHPQGWIVEAPEKDMVIVHDPSGGIQAIVQGIMAKPDVTPRQWLESIGTRYPGRFNKVQLDPVAQKRPTQATVQMRYTSRYGDGRASVLCFLNRGAGMMFAIATPLFRYDELAPTLMQVLQSFQVTQAPGAQAPQPGQQQQSNNPLAGIEFVRWQDPTENAFSLEVPKGWRPEGGITRRNAVDVHGWLRVTSPDGISVFSGDKDQTSYVVPDQTSAMGGFREGSRYSPGYGTQMIIMRYIPGVNFAEQYSQKMGAAQMKDRKPREDLAQRARANLTQGGPARQTVTYGEVSFLTRNNQAGYLLAGTQLTEIAGTGMWTVEMLLGFTAPPNRAATAQAVLGRMVGTYQINPQWFGGQQQAVAQTTRIVTETNNYVSQLQSQTYWATQGVQDRAAGNYSDMQRGIQVVVDPNTGQRYEAVAGHNYYYLPTGSNTTVASDTQAPPNIDLIELLPTRR